MGGGFGVATVASVNLMVVSGLAVPESLVRLAGLTLHDLVSEMPRVAV